MTLIDPTTPLGKIRLRTGDWGDIPILPDSVIMSVLDETSNNLPKAAAICAQYILATLTSSSHRKLGNLEVWGKEKFDNYIKFIQMTITNPSLAMMSPIPYSATAEFNPILEFQRSWSANYQGGTEAQQLSFGADISPNDNSRLGAYGVGYVEV